MYAGIVSLTSRAVSARRSRRPCSRPALHRIHGSLVRQEPPTPTLGRSTFTWLLPLGSEFAPAITSSTSTFSAPHSWASSLASATFASIHQLSASLTNSATSGVANGRTSIPSALVQNSQAAALLSSSQPPTTMGIVRNWASALPSARRSGQNARPKSRPCARPDFSSSGRTRPCVVPGATVLFRMTSWPGRSVRRDGRAGGLQMSR